MPMNGEHLGRIRGEVVIRQSRTDGPPPAMDSPDWEEIARVPNLFVNTGYALFAQYLASTVTGVTNLPPSHIAVGTGAVGVLGSDTALGFEVLRRKLTSAATWSTYTVRFVTLLAGTDAPNMTLTEIGLFANAVTFLPTDQLVVAPFTTTTVATGVLTWAVDQWKYWTVTLVSGTGAGQSRTVTANTTGGVLTIDPLWTTTPDATTMMTIGGASSLTTNPSTMLARANVSIGRTTTALSIIWSITLPYS